MPVVAGHSAHSGLFFLVTSCFLDLWMYDLVRHSNCDFTLEYKSAVCPRRIPAMNANSCLLTSINRRRCFQRCFKVTYACCTGLNIANIGDVIIKRWRHSLKHGVSSFLLKVYRVYVLQLGFNRIGSASRRIWDKFGRETTTVAEFLDEIQIKVLRVFFLAIHSHLYSFSLRFIFLQTHATSYSFYSASLYTVM
jgi:hypothetical protein